MLCWFADIGHMAWAHGVELVIWVHVSFCGVPERQCHCWEQSEWNGHYWKICPISSGCFYLKCNFKPRLCLSFLTYLSHWTVTATHVWLLQLLWQKLMGYLWAASYNLFPLKDLFWFFIFGKCDYRRLLIKMCSYLRFVRCLLWVSSKKTDTFAHFFACCHLI